MFSRFRQWFAGPEAGGSGGAPAAGRQLKPQNEDELIAAVERAADAFGRPVETPAETVDVFADVPDPTEVYDRNMARSPFQSNRQRENDVSRLPVTHPAVSKSYQLKSARTEQAAAIRAGDVDRVKTLRQEIAQLDADRDRVKAKYQAGQEAQVKKMTAGEGRAADQLRDPRKWAEAKAAEVQVEKLRAANPIYRRPSAKLSWWERTKRRFS